MQCIQAIVLKKQIYWMANVNYSQIARFYATNFFLSETVSLDVIQHAIRVLDIRYCGFAAEVFGVVPGYQHVDGRDNKKGKECAHSHTTHEHQTD